MTLYPNPVQLDANVSFTLSGSSKIKVVAIMNALGKPVSFVQTNNHVALKDVSVGTYIIRSVDGNRSVVSQLVVN